MWAGRSILRRMMRMAIAAQESTVSQEDAPQDPTTPQHPTGIGDRPRPPRRRELTPPRRPPDVTARKVPAPPYGKTRERPLARWLRRKREFLREELVAWKRMGIAVAVTVIVVVAFVLFKFPRTTF